MATQATVCDVHQSGIKINGVNVTGTGTEMHGNRATKIFKTQQEMAEAVMKVARSGVVIGCQPLFFTDAKFLCEVLNDNGCTFVYREEVHKHTD